MRLTVPFLIAFALLFLLAVPLWFAVLSAVGFVMPWFVVGLVFWAFLKAGHRPRHYRWGRHYWQGQWAPNPRPVYPRPPRPQPAPPPAPLSAAPVAKRPELPIELQVKVEQIRRKAEVLQGYAERFPPFSKDLYIVRQTTADYLPRTVEAYLALPGVDGDRIVELNGKPALQELKEQLDLLDSKLDDIAENLQQRDVDRLLANRRFLEERFGRAQT